MREFFLMLVKMKFSQRINTENRIPSGLRIPDGYFEDTFSKIASELPAKTPLQAMPLSKWQRLKPYIYMAAMFAGIWLTMKVFYDISSRASISLDNPPVELASLVNDNTGSLDYYELSAVSSGGEESSFRLENEVTDLYESMEDFERDFIKDENEHNSDKSS